MSEEGALRAVKGAAQGELLGVEAPSISKLNTPELVVALCGPIGSPIHEVGARLKQQMEDVYEYKCEIIRLSDFIRKHGERFADLGAREAGRSPDFSEKKILISCGNSLRAQYGSSVLADLAIHKIATTRPMEDPNNRTSVRRQCFIVDSIKNKEELKQLRMTYGDIFYFVGVFSPIERREEKLSETMDKAELHSLIDQDSGEEKDTGQTVRDVFPESDYFLRIDTVTNADIEAKVDRFLNVIFGTKLVTPTEDETAMYQAASAAGNSACLSRQVGAAITDCAGELLAVGWNDVPRFGGSVYRSSAASSDQGGDFRCWNLDGGVCFNDKEKDVLAAIVIDGLIVDGVVAAAQRDRAISTVRSSERLGKLLEFSRSIHAEMHALLSAGSVGGGRMKGGRLYATTYPCHACARHIIAAGIEKVFYIEPYRKSLAIKLHKDAITESDGSADKKVKILMYEGVAPRKYLSLYRVATGFDRKLNGRYVKKTPKEAVPILCATLESIPVLESLTVKKLQDLNLID